MALELSLDVVGAQIDVRDDRGRDAGPLRLCLQPPRLVDRVLDPERRLDVDDLRDAGAGGLGQELRRRRRAGS